MCLSPSRNIQNSPPASAKLSRGLVAVVLLAMAILPRPLSAADAGRKALAAIPAKLQQFVEAGKVSGAVVVVGRHDQVLSFDAVGLRNIAAQQAMTKDTLFRIASMTKPITALGIMILADEGKLSVDDPVEKHLPEFKGQMLAAGGAARLQKPSRPITIRDL